MHVERLLPNLDAENPKSPISLEIDDRVASRLKPKWQLHCSSARHLAALHESQSPSIRRISRFNRVIRSNIMIKHIYIGWISLHQRI